MTDLFEVVTDLMAREAFLAHRLGQLDVGDIDDLKSFWAERRFGHGAIAAFGQTAMERLQGLVHNRPIHLATVDGQTVDLRRVG